MSHIPVNIATEDELSAVTLETLLAYVDRGYSIGTVYRRGGYGYLKKTIRGWNQAARSTPFIVLTDLDTSLCPINLLKDWLTDPLHPNLVFRVAVREVDAWLLADIESLCHYLRVGKMLIPEDTDTLTDPKKAVVDLAKRSRSSELKSRMVPKLGSTAKQGPDYNGCLSSFVRTTWKVGVAKRNSTSLRRTLERFAAFKPVWP